MIPILDTLLKFDIFVGDNDSLETFLKPEHALVVKFRSDFILAQM